MNISKIGLGLVSILLLLIILVGFLGGIKIFETPLESNFSALGREGISVGLPDKDPKYSKVSGSLYENSKYNFSIEFPEGWDIHPGNRPTIIQSASTDGYEFSISVTVSVLKNFSGHSIKDIFSLQEHIDAIKQTNTFPNYKFIDAGESDVQFVPGYWIKSSVSPFEDEPDAVGLIYSFVKGDILYGVGMYGPIDKFNSMEPTFSKSLDSFIFKN